MNKAFHPQFIKTLQLLSRFDPDAAERAKENCHTQYAKTVKEAFIWHTSPEGFEYWKRRDNAIHFLQSFHLTSNQFLFDSTNEDDEPVLLRCAYTHQPEIPTTSEEPGQPEEIEITEISAFLPNEKGEWQFTPYQDQISDNTLAEIEKAASNHLTCLRKQSRMDGAADAFEEAQYMKMETYP